MVGVALQNLAIKKACNMIKERILKPKGTWHMAHGMGWTIIFELL
jgi:hypothetical protein